MNKRNFSLVFLLLFFALSQVGVNTQTPQKTLHVNGALQITNELNVGGNGTTAGSAGTSGQVLMSNGAGAAPSWELFNLFPNATGTLIVVNGVVQVAQEITLLMSADFTGIGSTTSGATVPSLIGNLTNEVIDNENLYTGTATANSFKVKTDGTYQIIMNVQLVTTAGTNPVIGIWDNTNVTGFPNGQWVARVNDTFTTDPAPSGLTASPLQTYTLITSIPMLASKTYSFRATNNNDFTIKQLSAGSTGSGPVTQVSIKRLK